MHRHSPYAESHLYFRKMSSKLAVWLTIRVMDGRISPYNSGCIEAVLARALQLLSQKAFSPVQIKETRGAARKWKTCLDARNLLKLPVKSSSETENRKWLEFATQVTGNVLLWNKCCCLIITTIIYFLWASVTSNFWPGSKNLVLCVTVIQFNNQTICITVIRESPTDNYNEANITLLCKLLH